MASLASTWYTEMDFDSWVLDILLLGWCGTAVAVYMSVNSIKSALGPVSRQPAVDRGWTREPAETDTAATAAQLAAQRGESCQWFNTAVSWLYLHYYNSPDYLDQWVLSLNQQLNKLGGPVQNKVEKVQHSSLPPRVLHVQYQTPPDGSVVLLTKVESQDLMLSIFASQQTSEGVRLTNCVAHVLKLNGVLRLKFYREKKDVKVRANFDSRPEVKIEVTPSNPYQEPSTLVDLGVVEQNMRNALGLAVTYFTITQLLMPGDLSQVSQEHHDEDAAPVKPGEIRVRASDAGWGMSSSDIALLNQRFSAQRLQNKMAQVAAFNQKQQASTPTIHEVTPNTRPSPSPQPQGGQPAGGEGVQTASVQPVRPVQPQTGDDTAKPKPAAAPLAGSGGL